MPTEKNKILKDDFNIKITRDLKKELDNMSGLMQPLIYIPVE